MQPGTKAKLPFVATATVKQIFKVLDDLRGVGYIEEGDTNCLITGESGCGKSELVKRYVEKYPRRELDEYTHVPVLYVKLRSPQTPKAFAQQILIALGDPQEGKGAKTREELYERIRILCVGCRVELVILDEVQTLIQNRSKGVIASISDWFKDLMNCTKVPVVLVGMPWCRGFVEENDQLDTRVGYRYYIETYKVSSGFNQYIKFIELFSKNYKFDKSFYVNDPEFAYRLFAYSSGIVRATVGQLVKVSILANKKGKAIDLKCFQEVLRDRGIKDEDNVFKLPITELKLREIVNSSCWIQQKSYKKERFKSAEFETYKLSGGMELVHCPGG